MRKAFVGAAFVMGLFSSTYSASSAYVMNTHNHRKHHHHLKVQNILQKPFIYLTGMASWYGPGFKGRTTASGQIFQPWKRICAMRHVKLGRVAIISNLENGRKTFCSILDIGPFVSGRIIDVSPFIKGQLHMGELAKVSIQVF